MPIQLPYTGVTTTETIPAPFTSGGVAIDVTLKEDKAKKGVANGYAPLDGNILLPTANLPSHTHTIANVTGLQAAIDGKQASGSYAPATGISPSAITGTAVVANDFASPPAIGAVTANSGAFTTIGASNVVNITASGSNGSTLRVGTLEFQPFSTNNCWIADNAYYNGGFYRRNGGAAGLFYFAGTEGQFRFALAGDAGTPFSASIMFKINLTGEMACGVSNSYDTGDFSGLGFYVNGANARCSLGSTGKFSFSGDANGNGTDDIAISRNASGVLEVNSGTAGTFRDLIVRNLRMSAPTSVPATAGATGSEGDMKWNSTHIYVCVATNTWKRVAIATF